MLHGKIPSLLTGLEKYRLYLLEISATPKAQALSDCHQIWLLILSEFKQIN